jgi:hypothetical protein
MTKADRVPFLGTTVVPVRLLSAAEQVVPTNSTARAAQAG